MLGAKKILKIQKIQNFENSIIDIREIRSKNNGYSSGQTHEF